MRVYHQFDAFFNADSQVLILGSFPSVKSREENFYYAHPQNRFWKVLAQCFNERIPETLEDKKKLCIKHKIALWDVIDSCEIDGSSDSSIKNVVLTDIKNIIEQTNLCIIIVNGKTAYRYYKRHQFVSIMDICLPSTSAANAQYKLEDLVNIWGKVLNPDV